MSSERQHSHVHSSTESEIDREDLAPGRSSKSALLRRSDDVIASGLVQRKARDANGVADGAEDAVAAASSSSGSALPDSLMRKFESSLGADLSSVRVHTGNASAAANDAVGAKAYTVGQDIHFGAGQYDPSSPAGEHLLAHEVAHTVQQAGGAQRRQHKLEVSSPGDGLEHEADRAADAMVAGQPAMVSTANGVARTVLQRDPISDVKSGAKVSGLPDVNAGDPVPGAGLIKIGPDIPIDLTQTKVVSKNGVPYEVPTSDYRKVNPLIPMPDLDKPMPKAAIPDPGAIPGWHTVIPETKTGGPIVLVIPAQPDVVRGANHHPSVQQAWEDYRTVLIPEVQRTWNEGARVKLDAFTQQKNESPELKKLLDETSKHYEMAPLKSGKGSVSTQGLAQQIVPGQSISTVASKVDAGGSALLDGAKASAAQPEDTVMATPIKLAVNGVNMARANTRALAKKLDGVNEMLDGARTDLSLANAEVDELKAKPKPGELSDDVKDAIALATIVDPRLGEIATTLAKYAPLFSKLHATVSAGAGALSGNPTAIYDAVTKVADLAGWLSMQTAADRVAELVGGNPAFAKCAAAARKVSGLAKFAEGLGMEAKELLKLEKTAYDALARALADGWKGANKADGALAAHAMHALPRVEKMIRVLEVMRSDFPSLPSGTTRMAQGHALATKGDPAPGTSELQQTVAWIDGAPKIVEAELPKWRTIHAQLSKVSAALGVE